VDRFVAISRHVARRIERCYGRSADVIYPPVDVSRFRLAEGPGEFYLIVSALTPYKRVDLAVDAFNRLRLPLLVVGTGQDERRLKNLAGPTVDFLGSLSNPAVQDLLAKCRAFVFPGKEDFGIAAVEALAAGTPVIAYGAGGILDIVGPGTGLLYEPQSSDALAAAVERFERGEVAVDEAACRARAAPFTRERFQRHFADGLRRAWRAGLRLRPPRRRPARARQWRDRPGGRRRRTGRTPDERDGITQAPRG
jgi:glycosyltransferase involved in cell wall biosynthesis